MVGQSKYRKIRMNFDENFCGTRVLKDKYKIDGINLTSEPKIP